MSGMRSTDSNTWNPASWQTRKAQQQPVYEDSDALSRAVADLSRLPPIVVSWEIENLRERLAVRSAATLFCYRVAIAPRASRTANQII